MEASQSLAGHVLSKVPVNLHAGLFSRGRAISLGAEQCLFLAGDASNGCYRVDEGLLKVNIITAAGTARILAILGPGAIVGELSMLDGRPRSASVEAIRPSRLCFISNTVFEDFTTCHPELYRQLAVLLAERLRATNHALVAATLMSLKGRTARALLSLADAFGQSVGDGRILIRQRVTQADIAAMAGISRENASRVLSLWVRDAALSRISGYYCLENKAAIEGELDI
jgi:CRP/FNR family cyclic AMP-dependent transcriptional regulator